MNSFSLFAIATGCAASYLLGSIPFGLLLGKWFGAGDIRNIGSGNIGATNMLRTGRKGLAAATLALDFVKGILGVAVAQGISNYIFLTHAGDFVIAPDIKPWAGIAAVMGHVFPVWLAFKGGKGVATTLGVFFVTAPPIGLITAMGWLFFFYMTRVSSLSAIASIASAPILGYFYASRNFAIMAFVLAVIVIYKHKDNIQRLREGKEIALRKTDDPS